MGSVLIVDDVAGSTRLIAALLAPDGYAVRTVDAASPRCSWCRPTRPIWC